ncbi:TetR/AcrR family transcriptional regulator C-terminal domain-containing protein [Tistrella mobilis]
MLHRRGGRDKEDARLTIKAGQTVSGDDMALRQTRRPGKRAGLDLRQIVQAARQLDIADLSIQSLADRLNVDRKALHYHVKDRQSLFELVALDRFAERLTGEGVAAAEDWRDACRVYAREFVDSVTSLGELSEYLWFNEAVTAWALEPAEALFAQLNAAGFPDEDAVRMVTMLATLCLGHARDIVQAGRETERPRPRSLRAALSEAGPPGFPNLERIAGLGVDTYSAAQLAFSVEIFLEGAEAVLGRARASAGLVR